MESSSVQSKKKRRNGIFFSPSSKESKNMTKADVQPIKNLSKFEWDAQTEA